MIHPLCRDIEYCFWHEKYMPDIKDCSACCDNLEKRIATVMCKSKDNELKDKIRKHIKNI